MRILGITDEKTDCDCCGKRNLKCTVALEMEDGGIVYYGRDCAGKAVHGRKNRRNTDDVTAQAHAMQELQPVIDAALKYVPYGLDVASDAAVSAANAKSWIWRGATDSGPLIKFWRTSNRLRIDWIGAQVLIEPDGTVH